MAAANQAPSSLGAPLLHQGSRLAAPIARAHLYGSRLYGLSVCPLSELSTVESSPSAPYSTPLLYKITVYELEYSSYDLEDSLIVLFQPRGTYSSTVQL